MKFGDLTYEEIKVHAEAGALAVVPTGCTEQQGPHLTVDNDTWFADTVCVSAAERAKEKHGLDVIVLPVSPFGPTPEHRDFGSGFVDIPEKLHQDLVAATLKSLADQGFKKIVVWRGCGQHRLDGVVDGFNSTQTGNVTAYLPAHPYHDIWMKHGDSRDAGGHADSFITAIALYLRPDSVRKDKIVESGFKPVNWNDANLNFAEYSPNGVIGTPVYATAQLGRILWHEVVEFAVDVFKRISEDSDCPTRACSRRPKGRG